MSLIHTVSGQLESTFEMLRYAAPGSSEYFRFTARSDVVVPARHRRTRRARTKIATGANIAKQRGNRRCHGRWHSRAAWYIVSLSFFLLVQNLRWPDSCTSHRCMLTTGYCH